MTLKHRQLTILSNAPLKGTYNYGKIFQLFPHDIQIESFQHDNPIVLELSFEAEIYPTHSGEFWHRDVWEKERYEFFSKRSPQGEMDSNDQWVQAYQASTSMRRQAAIIEELCNLLTLFSKNRFFIYEQKQGWYSPQEPEKGTKSKTIWAWLGFGKKKETSRKSNWGHLEFVSEYNRNIDKFTNVEHEAAPVLTMPEFSKRVRDAIYVGEEHQILFPENLSSIFDIFFSLPSDKKSAFYLACHLYNQAITYATSAPSLSLVASVMSVEKLMNYETDDENNCPECGAPSSVETCTTCGAPIYRLRSKFREFMSLYAHSENGDLYRDMYDTRSRLAHGGLLRDDLFDTGFYSGEKDNEAALKRESLIVVRDALLNWLIESQSNQTKAT